MLSWARGDDGFTLVELLVAMTMSLIVIFGASAIIVSSLDATNQVRGRVAALEEGRTGLEILLQQLNSGCLANDVSPMQASTASGISPVVNSDASHLVFVSGVGDGATATPTEHVVDLRAGALVDYAYANTGGSPASLGTASTWTFSSTPSSTQVLMENVVAGSVPMFQYYSYSNSANQTAGSLLGAASLVPPLTTTTAPAVAEVDIDLRVGPADVTSNPTETSELMDSATFRLTAADPLEVNYPCD